MSDTTPRRCGDVNEPTEVTRAGCRASAPAAAPAAAGQRRGVPGRARRPARDAPPAPARRARTAGRRSATSPRPGLAASRGGRRSTLVELSPDLRFAAVDLGASSIDVEVVNGRLEPVAAYAEPADIRTGPKVILQRVNELLHKAKADGAYERARRGRHRRARAGQLPRRRAGLAADHAGLGPLPGARAAHPRARLPGGGRQRRQHHGDRRAARRGRPLGRRLPLREDRHRHRLRHLPGRRGLPGHRRVRRRHRPHPGRLARSDVLVRQRRLPGGAVQRRRAGQGRHGGGPLAARRRRWPSGSRPPAWSPPATSPRAPSRAT